MARNMEIAEANTLRLRARTAVRGLGLPPTIKKVVLSAIDDVELPLHRFYKVPKPDTARAFINKVMAGIGDDVDMKIKEKIEKCLHKTIL